MKIFGMNVFYNVSRSFQFSCRKSKNLAKNIVKRKDKKMADNSRGTNSALEGLTIGNLTVWPWSISGIESTITVKGDGFKLAFDMGYATSESVKCKHVFLTHGHIDHVAGVVHHAAKRKLYSMEQATYFCPEELVDKLQSVSSSFCALTDNNVELKVKGVKLGDKIPINGNTYVCPFPTCHRVTSQGYIVYTKKKNLKPEFVGKDKSVISEAIRSKQEVHNETLVPVVAYTGDTMIEVFNNPPIDDLLKVKLLITEATYIDNQSIRGKPAIEHAKSYGHIHLQELLDSAEAFENVGNILLVHFSSRYSVPYISEKVEETFKNHPNLYKKIYLGNHLMLLK